MKRHENDCFMSAPVYHKTKNTETANFYEKFKTPIQGGPKSRCQ